MKLRTKWTSEGGNATKKCGQAFVKNGQHSRELSLKWTTQSGKWTTQSGNYGGRKWGKLLLNFN